MAPQLTRLMIIFAIITASFLILRSVARPDSFGWYGHYRGDALPEAASKPVRYVQSSQCADCHDEEANQHAAGSHVKISCQACHGPGQLHVDDPSSDNIQRPQVAETCLRCHAISSARPAKFPQVEAVEHAEGESCASCHPVHAPNEIGG